MKTRLIFSFLFSTLVLVGCARDGITSPDAGASAPAEQSLQNLEESLADIPVSPVTQSVNDDIAFMREEEKLARDVYLHFAAKYGVPMFSNIASSEAQHMAALKVLLTRHAIPDPVTNDAPGVYTNPAFTALYAQLTTLGDVSLLNAYIVGATIEDLDIKDLMDRSAATTAADILRVYSSLTRGSRNHLRSFYSGLTAAGGTYAPQYISRSLFDSIITSRNESGRPW